MLPTGLLCDPEDTIQFFAQSRHIPADLVVSDARIDLSRGDPFVPQHLADCLQRYALSKRSRRREGVPSRMHGRIEPEARISCHMLHRHIH